MLKTVDVIILDPNLLKTEKNELELVKKAIKNGKGGLFATIGWRFEQVNPTSSLKYEAKGNILLADAGIEWTSGFTNAKQIYFLPDKNLPQKIPNLNSKKMPNMIWYSSKTKLYTLFNYDDIFEETLIKKSFKNQLKER